MFGRSFVESSTRHPFGYWTSNAAENTRRFFDEFAKARNLDPLIPDNWYNVTKKQIAQAGVSILCVLLLLVFSIKCKFFRGMEY
jgi:hypothetical protein